MKLSTSIGVSVFQQGSVRYSEAKRRTVTETFDPTEGHNESFFPEEMPSTTKLLAK
jgi:hypothetical protein